MKIIFLDFDGVMDTAYYDLVLNEMELPERDAFGVVFDPECVRNLRFIVEQTGADIVVSSTWKYFMTYRDFLDMWEARELPGFVTDVTPTLAGRHDRGDEIDEWLKDCKEECRYAIIDDLDATNFNEHQIPHLFVVNPFHGLDELTAQRVGGAFDSIRAVRGSISYSQIGISYNSLLFLSLIFCCSEKTSYLCNCSTSRACLRIFPTCGMTCT